MAYHSVLIYINHISIYMRKQTQERRVVFHKQGGVLAKVVAESLTCT